MLSWTPMAVAEEGPRILSVRRAAAVILPLAFFLAVTWPAADFGYHWDEPWAQIRPLESALERGSLLSGYYIYPGLNLWLNLSALAPDYLASRNLVEAVEGRPYLLRARRLRIAVAGLAIVWVYLLALALGRSVGVALAAASLVAASWEVVYHSRWLAPDSVLMQFGILAAGCAVAAERQPHRRLWTVSAAVAAGLACGVKYPGGLVLLPAVLAVSTRSGSDARDRLKRLLEIGIVFAVTYLLTTPGTILEYREFRGQLLRAAEIYGSEGWFGYSVERPHPGKIVAYLASALSPWPAVAWALFGCALWGAGRLLSSDRRTALILLAFPAAYGAYFSLQVVMMVRNYQVLIPFVAVCAAVGIGDVRRRLPLAGFRVLWVLAAVAAVAANAVWQVEACRGILGREDHRAGLRALDDHIEAEPRTFFLSERTVEGLAFLDRRTRPNVVEEADRSAVVAASLRELGADFPANRGRLLSWFGPREVNLNRYPSWSGQDRPVLLSAADAAEVPLALSQLVRRRIAFPVLPAGREVLFLAGGARAGDQVYVEPAPEGGVRFGVESWGTAARADEPVGQGPRGFTDAGLRVEPGRSYLLEIDWGVARGELRVALDSRLVFSRYGPLHPARLGELRVGGAAVLPGRGGAAFSGTLGPAAAAGPWRPLGASAADPRRLALAGDADRALPAALWEAASEDLESTRAGGALVVVTPRERFAPAARYGPLVLPVDGEYLFRVRFEVEAPSVLGPLWDDGALALGVRSDGGGGRWLAFRRTSGRISEWDPELRIRFFAPAGAPVWLVAMNDPPRGLGASRLTLEELDVLVR